MGNEVISMKIEKPKRGRPRIQIDYQRILELRQGGQSIRGIARETGISKSKVQQCLSYISGSSGMRPESN